MFTRADHFSESSNLLGRGGCVGSDVNGGRTGLEWREGLCGARCARWNDAHHLLLYLYQTCRDNE